MSDSPSNEFRPSDTPVPASPEPSAAPAARGRGFLATVRLWLGAILATLLVVLAVANLDPVPVSWIFGEGQVRLVFVIVASIFVGVLLGQLLFWRRRRSHGQ